MVLRHTVCAIKNESRVTLAALIALGRTVCRAGRLDTASITGPCADAVVASGWTSHGAKLGAPPELHRDASFLTGCSKGSEGITETKVLAMGMTYVLQAYPEERPGADMAQAAAKGTIWCP